MSTVPVPSDLAEDLLFNAQKIDESVSSAATSYVDRLGVPRMTLAGAIATLIAINPRGAWVTATAYAVKDLVTNGGVFYICVVAHTSSASFATDSPTRWRVYQEGVAASQLISIASAANGSGMVGHDDALAYAASTVGNALKLLKAGNFTAINNTGNTALGNASTDTLNVGLGALIYDGAGRVGISANPATKLHINGGAVGEVRMQGSGMFLSGYDTAGTTRLGFAQFNAGPAGTIIAAEGASNPVIVSTNGTSKFTVSAAGLVDLVSGSGSQRFGGHPSRFQSSEQSCPTTTGVISVAHGGTRRPDWFFMVLICKVAESTWAVNRVVRVEPDSTYSQHSQMEADDTNIYWNFVRSGSAPAIRTASGVGFTVTASSWRAILCGGWN